MADQVIDAYWFSAADVLPHGDGRPIVIGEAHEIEGKIVLCRNALHASRHPFDALQHAPGPFLHKVRCSIDVIEDYDKLGCRRREYAARIDATALLRRFAREQASSVLHLWDAPPVVREYLATGDETIREAARAAAEAARAARAAAEAARAARAAAARAAAAYAAARAAAWGAARGAAEAAAWAAAEAAAARDRFSVLVQEAFDDARR